MARNHRPGHSKPHGPKELTSKRDEEIWTLRTDRMLTHQQIADQLGIDQSTVTKSLQRTAARRSESLDRRVEQYRESLAAQLDKIISETYAAWERAQRDPDAKNAQYLNTNIKAIERLSKMLGIDAPQKVESDNTHSVRDVFKQAIIDVPEALEDGAE